MAIDATTTGGVRTRITDKTTLVAGNGRPDRAAAGVRAVMAGLAQKRAARDHQRRDIGTVWRMAVGAVLDHRLVFEQERATLLGMALPAGFVDGVLLDHARAG